MEAARESEEAMASRQAEAPATEEAAIAVAAVWEEEEERSWWVMVVKILVNLQAISTR
jgi:hypothetical protein